MVDNVVETVSNALKKNAGVTAKAVERWYSEMPREEEMLPKDKYTIFDRKEKKYRKGIHSTHSPPSCAKPPSMQQYLASATTDDDLTELPKWTRVSQRLNPPGF